MDAVIRIKLPADRTKTGTLTLESPVTGLPLYGPVPVLGRAARNIARKYKNPTANPLLPYGDTPTGTYAMTNIQKNGAGTSRPVVQYGENGSLVLEPESGDALAAKNNHRIGLLIHAGRHANSSVTTPSALKPTSGCIRMLDWDLQQLIAQIKANALLFPGKVSVDITDIEGPQGDIDESVDDVDPPPLDGGVILP